MSFDSITETHKKFTVFDSVAGYWIVTELLKKLKLRKRSSWLQISRYIQRLGR